MTRKQKLSLLLPAITAAVIGLLALSAVTFAWISADIGPYTNVTPMEGKISQGEGSLLICQTRDGRFDRSCPLNPADLPAELMPVSTADLEHFYTDLAQDRRGYIISFQDSTQEVGQFLIRGTVYLQNQGGACDVYLSTPELEISGTPQFIDAGRLGLRFITDDGTATSYIFTLDDLGSTQGSRKMQTVIRRNAVVAGVSDLGVPVFADDPAQSISQYHRDNEERQPLVSMDYQQTIQVDYWLYLEGCDDGCCNPVQSQDITLQLGFAGAPLPE